MADEKNKEENTDAPKKKGMSPLVLIAVGAVLGGAGVVVGVPAKTVEVPAAAVTYSDLNVLHEDVITKTFNPKTRAGKAVAKVSFQFRFSCREDRYDPAYQLVADRWEDGLGAVGKVLRRTSVKELTTEAGETMLEARLVDALNDELFHADGGEALAEVTKIVNLEIQLQ
ncbi:MAG: hypothetical protein ACON4Z_12980 [Planctomycetota bacterium]